MKKDTHWIESAEALRRLVDELRTEACLGLDTEFVWERTYRAQLGLVQIGLASGTCYLVDPLAIGDLSPLGDLLADEGIEKILHDAPQDLMILRQATGVSARRVFDTRLAAGFAGLPSTLSLGRLLEELLGIHLAKAHTRADWTARPLAPEVLEYAEEDVRYLPETAERLRGRARAAGVEAWLAEELAGLDQDPVSDEQGDEEAWRRIRAASALAPRSLAVLRELAAWRERAARAADRPRRWLVDDGGLVAVAEAMPRTAEELQGCSRVEASVVRRHGPELLAAVERAQARPSSEWPGPVWAPRRDAAFRKALEGAQAALQERAARFGIDPALVCSRSDLARWLQEGPDAREEDHALLRGWRAELLGECLAGWRGGQASLGLS